MTIMCQPLQPRRVIWSNSTFLWWCDVVCSGFLGTCLWIVSTSSTRTKRSWLPIYLTSHLEMTCLTFNMFIGWDLDIFARWAPDYDVFLLPSARSGCLGTGVQCLCECMNALHGLEPHQRAYLGGLAGESRMHRSLGSAGGAPATTAEGASMHKRCGRALEICWRGFGYARSCMCVYHISFFAKISRILHAKEICNPELHQAHCGLTSSISHHSYIAPVGSAHGIASATASEGCPLTSTILRPITIHRRIAIIPATAPHFWCNAHFSPTSTHRLISRDFVCMRRH